MNEVKKFAASYARAFAAASLTLFMAGETDWNKLFYAGCAAVLPPLLRWLNPKDAAFGVKAE
jgi:hypothetical protein